ncbi:MAG: flagellar basal body L-ring protein FlgH [candidate division Zixibacteria bacterium]|nr:flagellar basal body L-ring protein FlgH [candidate division Zixibacteria bacterium]
MNAKRLLIFLALFLLLPFSLKLRGQDFGKGQSLFSDIKAAAVGDILTVLIVEQSRATNQVETKTEKSTEISTAGGPGIGSLDFIPMFGGKADNSNKYDGKGENLRAGSIRAKMSVTVVEVRQSGDLVVEGSRVIGINGDEESLYLSGVIRSRDLSPDNTIESYLIADAEISYTGKGNASTGSRPGFFTRLINWVF